MLTLHMPRQVRAQLEGSIRAQLAYKRGALMDTPNVPSQRVTVTEPLGTVNACAFADPLVDHPVMLANAATAGKFMIARRAKESRFLLRVQQGRDANFTG